MASAQSSAALEFGPNRAPIWFARIFGVAACLSSGLLLFAGIGWDQGAGMLAVCTVFGLIGEAFGIWMLLTGSRISRFRATVTPGGLRLAAATGRSIWLQGAVTQVTVEWSEVQGFSRVDIMNPAAQSGTQGTYILYTKQGDFNLNDVQWKNLDALMQEISRRSGHAPGDVAAERTSAQTELHSSERRMRSAERIFGWSILAITSLLLLPVIAGGLAIGFSSDLAKAAFFLVFAIAAAASMIRFYRRR
jgi:hypothetical protein